MIPPEAMQRMAQSKFLSAACATFLMLASATAQENQSRQANGARPVKPELFLRTGDVVALCLRRELQIQALCEGLAQAYAEVIVLQGKACIPVGTSRQDLLQTLIGPDVVVSTGYIDRLPAFETAKEMFIRHYPCE